MPPSQVFGGWVVTPRVDGRSAAQNMNPSMPRVVPTRGATVWTNEAVAFWSDASKFAHSGRTCEPSATYRLPVNLAGARGR